MAHSPLPPGDRFPSVAEAFGYLRQSVALLNREGGVVLLVVSFLVAQWVGQAALRAAIPDEAVYRPASAWLTALLFTPFAAGAILKVRRAVEGRGVRWVPALEAAGRSVLRLQPADWLLAALLGWVLVGPPLIRGLAETSLIAAGLATAAAPVAAVALLARRRGRTLLTANLLLVILVTNYLFLMVFLAGFLYISQVSAALGPVSVDIAGENDTTLTLPLRAGNVLAPGLGFGPGGEPVFLCPADPAGLSGCLRQALPAESYGALAATVGGAKTLSDIVSLASIPAALLLLLPRFALALPAAALEGGLGFARSWRLTRGRFRTSFWLVAMLLAASGFLASGPGLLLLAAGGGVAGLYAVRQLGHGRRLEEVARSTFFLGALGAAGLGFALALLQPLGLGGLLARLFALAVGGTAFTLFYLRAAGATPDVKAAETQIPREE
ncbi:MAG: hypothetical protein QXT68_06595 [Halobacteria archaeon]